MVSKTVTSSLTTMSVIMQPGDANFLGKVFGGKLLSLIDLCAYTTAARYSGEACVTASFDRVDFLEPIEVGEVVTLHGRVSYVGRTSVEVTIQVDAENILQGTKRHTNTARVTMVAIRDNKAVPVPRLICESREDKISFLSGKLRRELRSYYTEERRKIEQQFEHATDEELDRLLQSDTLS